MSTLWTCQRVTNGQKCGFRNPGVKRNCLLCGKPKPKKRLPAHMTALKAPYEEYVELNGGERCGICGCPPKGRRLNRDHDHATGKARGLLCHPCNRFLVAQKYGLKVTPDWLASAAAYLGRAA